MPNTCTAFALEDTLSKCNPPNHSIQAVHSVVFGCTIAVHGAESVVGTNEKQGFTVLYDRRFKLNACSEVDQKDTETIIPYFFRRNTSFIQICFAEIKHFF